MHTLLIFFGFAGGLVWLIGTAAIFATGVQNQIHGWKTPTYNWSLLTVAFISVCAMLTVFIETLP